MTAPTTPNDVDLTTTPTPKHHEDDNRDDDNDNHLFIASQGRPSPYRFVATPTVAVDGEREILLAESTRLDNHHVVGGQSCEKDQHDVEE